MVSTPLTYSSLATYASQEESDDVNDVPARSGSSPCDFTIKFLGVSKLWYLNY